MSKNLSRREFIVRGATVAAGLSLASGLLEAGCSSSSSSNGSTVIVGVEAEESGFDPSSSRFDSTGVMYARTVFDPLAIIDANGNVRPYLASSIEPSPDYTSWTIRLRPGIYFHDGTPLDAAALKMNFDNYKAAALTTITIPLIEDTVVVDPLTVRIDMSKPWVPFNYWLAGLIGGQIAYVMSPKMILKQDGYGPDRPSGTGPFIFQEWVPNSHFRAVRNPRYWRKGYPFAPAIEFRPIVDENQRLNSLAAGTVDLIHTSDSLLFNRLKSQGFRMITDEGKIVGEPDVGCVLINHGQPPFDHPSARFAVAYATDLKDYVRVATQNTEPAIDGPFVPGTPYYPGPTGYPSFDLNKAKQYVAQYERETGQPLAFTLGTVPSPQVLPIVQLLQNMWQQAGMKVSIDTSIQQSTLISNAISGSYQAYLWRQFAAVHPDLNYIFWTSKTIYKAGNTVIAINMAENVDPVIDQALDDARSNPDQAAAIADYQTVAKRFAQDIPYVWLTETNWAIASRPNVVGWDKPLCPDGTLAFPMISGIIWPSSIRKV